MDAEMPETAQQAAAREARGAQQEQLQADVQSMRAAFYCADCRKQYKTVSEMENHLSSYDHHHTKRLRQLQQQKRRTSSEEQHSAKRRKEQQQEELMLQRRIAAQAKAAEAKVATERKKEAEATQSNCTAKVGFSFGGGVKMGAKKSVKKPLTGRTLPSAFTNPFSQ
ncbi:unnamed protein product [Phytophthora fragariaefolia]|uniref:Unnamed protein product n=1 Tax=Phytophthora fragariaefolia TaxID=1490495 RepID=A0A9W6XAR6_9STRA|nr:unnamed protein product [Phytophthora fragariaefolia]